MSTMEGLASTRYNEITSPKTKPYHSIIFIIFNFKEGQVLSIFHRRWLCGSEGAKQGWCVRERETPAMETAICGRVALSPNHVFTPKPGSLFLPSHLLFLVYLSYSIKFIFFFLLLSSYSSPWKRFRFFKCWFGGYFDPICNSFIFWSIIFVLISLIGRILHRIVKFISELVLVKILDFGYGLMEDMALEIVVGGTA